MARTKSTSVAWRSAGAAGLATLAALVVAASQGCSEDADQCALSNSCPPTSSTFMTSTAGGSAQGGHAGLGGGSPAMGGNGGAAGGGAGGGGAPGSG